MANHSKHSQSGRSAKAGGDRKKSTGLIRIVAGRWRGRKIPVVDSDGLRPTGDRVRETLFNWLQLDIAGSRCLDLYAGSGALGLEAASRGAASVSLVEAARPVAEQLRQTLAELNADDRVMLHALSAEQFLATKPAPFNVVFVDPPFDQQVHQRILEALTLDCLAPDAKVYVELPTSQIALLDKIPGALLLLKEKRFGDVTVFLLQFDATRTAPSDVAP